MARPLVSVVLPTHDRPELLRRAVETVTAQTYDRVELVVVDDRSERPAADVLAEVDTSGLEAVVCERHDRNRGGNAARNTGIRTAAGEFVAFLDDDDEWEPAKLERQVAAFEAGGPDIGVVYTGSRYVHRDGERVLIDHVHGDVTDALLAGANVAEFSALMVRASVIANAGLPEECLRSWQDREWLLRLSLHCSFEVVPEPLTIRHWDHSGRIGEQFEYRRDISFPIMLDRHLPLARERGLERQFVGTLRQTLAISAAQNGYYREAVRQAWRALRVDPFLITAWLYFWACLGGEWTYRPAARVIALLRSL
ncbi:glycosyltransferase family 2 protein [Halocalculus aciditolerans]|uniref:Glycosyltransferase 2-like domain-containing protein n=1 Tax=Halocalculus aciditolerans TaxID=1383812 RepID=A0A830FHK3_9EURY|nr:glycosyltransferase family 2 protein [Halocalculus aciditolerans]GGL55938.1 hypothetical protein GCM10009039_12650 [Halocalculus aciditolerans]